MELQQRSSCHDEMISLLRKANKESFGPKNPFNPAAKLPYMDSLLNLPHSTDAQIRYCNYLKANILLELGREKESIRILERLTKETSLYGLPRMKKDLAMAYMRQGERANCVTHHASASCILPIQGLGLHEDMEGSQKAIKLFEEVIRKEPDDIESKWLLNIAYMTLGKYPDEVPREFFIPGMEGDTAVSVRPFEDVASDLKLDVNDMAGGSVTEDFDNDGYLDIIISSWALGSKMHYFKNNANGSFTDVTGRSGLKEITGGLNMIQADYNNDGFIDILVLRGAWKEAYGKEPNSLLRNNGDGTFTDVTTQSGLLSFHPTQTATWNDFNNDGWLDLFIGNETASSDLLAEQHPCELYINNQDGTFREIANEAKINVTNYVKGVTSGDYNNDGLQDLFLSTLDGGRRLFKNMGVQNNEVVFEEVTNASGLGLEKDRTFTTWFWDYNNDGWLDILTGNYSFDKSLAYYAAAEKLDMNEGNEGHMILYENNQDGTFTNVSKAASLDETVFVMGGNFGDIDNDGFLDMYLGTGNPRYQSLIPNKMYKNMGGKQFADITSSARVGHLQKGHAVSFADMDNDGDQDIYVEMGGAYPGDGYQNSFFLNPGQNNNRWIGIALQGDQANRSAIGARIKVTIKENGILRNIYRDVNSGGSFGASPLRREIGLGQADKIESLEILWPGSKTPQVFKNIKPNQFIKITQGRDQLSNAPLKKIEWILPNRICYPGTDLDTTNLN